jgi:hypothetical protein
MGRRKGNTQTEIYRKGWESPRKLRTSNKNSPLVVTDPHLSLIGHTNKAELLQNLNDIEISNGFANRILWCASKRLELKPDAEYLDWRNHPGLVDELKTVFKQRFANTEEPVTSRVIYSGRLLGFSVACDAGETATRLSFQNCRRR